ncbi:hypothetical protein EAX62_12100 [Tessaracoccus antarcticus]|uniref:Uncharacterized protein n=1 Tax=Tessaracoccus antarcticus TaxID=2479848 RepID=A0A3M0GBY8_9ACTN|nr:hypothetical protein EAX62_12100 [Tessaracoccus antarcticus]
MRRSCCAQTGSRKHSTARSVQRADRRPLAGRETMQTFMELHPAMLNTIERLAPWPARLDDEEN